MRRRSTTQDITWFMDLLDNKQINLDPPYQRRSVWTRKDRLFYLDSIFKGYPCPAIFLHKTTNERGKATYHVVDGKQRLETIFLYSAGRISMPRDHSDAGLAGKKITQLTQENKQKFWDYVLAVDLLDSVEQAVVDEVFDRLNRNSRKLERQELRHAKYDGWLIHFAEGESELSEWQELGVSSTARAKRMKDVQFITELIINTLTTEPRGFSQDDIDEFCAEYDSPNEEVPNFDESTFVERFTKIRDYLLSMERHNQCLTTYARTFMHFYSIWSYLSKCGTETPATGIADKYLEFMQECSNIEREELTDDYDNFHMKYAGNSVGANTELPQRMGRLDALMAALQ